MLAGPQGERRVRKKVGHLLDGSRRLEGRFGRGGPFPGRRPHSNARCELRLLRAGRARASTRTRVLRRVPCSSDGAGCGVHRALANEDTLPASRVVIFAVSPPARPSRPQSPEALSPRRRPRTAARAWRLEMGMRKSMSTDGRMARRCELLEL